CNDVPGGTAERACEVDIHSRDCDGRVSVTSRGSGVQASCSLRRLFALLRQVSLLPARELERPKPLRMLPDEARDPARVPEGSARQQAPVDLRRVPMCDHGCRHAPTLPAGLRGAVAKLDVLAVEAELLVETAQLGEQ